MRICKIFNRNNKNRKLDKFVVTKVFRVEDMNYFSGFTALHSVEHGFRTVFVEDACRGVTQEGMEKMTEKLRHSGIVMAQSNEVSVL